MRHNKEIVIISVDPVFHKDGTSLKKVYWDNDGTTEVVYWKNDTLVIPMVTDRTIDDVRDWETLRNKIINQTATASEIAEWKTYELRGCLNHTDFNRYGKVLNWLAVLAKQIVYPYTPKTDYTFGDIGATEINKLLANVRVIRNLTGMPTPTPQVPTSIVGFGDVNAIEEILVTGEETIHNTQLGFRYCGEIYSNGSY